MPNPQPERHFRNNVARERRNKSGGWPVGCVLRSLPAAAIVRVRRSRGKPTQGIIVPIRELCIQLQDNIDATDLRRVPVCPDDPNLIQAPDRRPTGLQTLLNGILRDGQTAILYPRIKLNEDSTT